MVVSGSVDLPLSCDSGSQLGVQTWLPHDFVSIQTTLWGPTNMPFHCHVSFPKWFHDAGQQTETIFSSLHLLHGQLNFVDLYLP